MPNGNQRTVRLYSFFLRCRVSRSLLVISLRCLPRPFDCQLLPGPRSRLLWKGNRQRQADLHQILPTLLSLSSSLQRYEHCGLFPFVSWSIVTLARPVCTIFSQLVCGSVVATWPKKGRPSETDDLGLNHFPPLLQLASSSSVPSTLVVDSSRYAWTSAAR